MRRVPREYSEPLSSQASGRVMKRMLPLFHPPYVPAVTLTLGSVATVPGSTLEPDGWGWKGKEKKGVRTGFVGIPLPSFLSPSI